MFLSLIEQCYRELLSNVYVDEHRTYYERYFIVTETKYGRSVEPVNPYTEIESPICDRTSTGGPPTSFPTQRVRTRAR